MMNFLQKNQKLMALFLSLCFLSFSTLAQETGRVSGKVTSAVDGEGLPGVNVIVKGTTNGTITDIEGNYNIETSPEATLVFSSIGFLPQELIVGTRSTMDIAMDEDIQQLGEVVVVGYGTQKKSDLTGAIASVKGEELRKFASASPVDALQGAVPGLSIVRSSGGPSANAQISIRGLRAIGGAGPLVIVDGIQSDINLINPDDIESVEVLKDAAAASIYGSVAANGVIIISTKTGTKGKTSLEFNTYYGVDQIQNKLEFTNASQYEQIARQAATNSGNAGGPDFLNDSWSANTQWADELFSNGVFKNYNLTLRGGTDNMNYMLSGSLNDREGILMDANRNKKQIRAKVGGTKGILNLNANIFYANTSDNYFAGTIDHAYEIMPIVPVFDNSKASGYGYIPDAGYTDTPDHINPLGENALNDASQETNDLATNFSATVDIMKGLKATGRIGIHNRNRSVYNRSRPGKVANKRETFYHSLTEGRYDSLGVNLEGFLNYDKTFGDHSIGVMAGLSQQTIEVDWTQTSKEGKKLIYSVDGSGNLVTTEVSTGFADPSFNTFNAGQDGITSAAGSSYEIARQSQYGRVNYSYADRYLIQASIRRDGSSRFGTLNRWGVFPSVALGWKVSNESFFNVDAISFLKLRASWGKLGSESDLGAYDFAVFTAGPYRYPFGVGESQSLGSTFRAFENKDLKWEASQTTNIGLDLGFFEDRLTAEMNYYVRNTADMIIPNVLPGSAGYWDPSVNFGDVENKGFELDLSYRKNVGDFQYTISGNLFTNSNEITKVASPDGTDVFLGSDTTTDGEPANISKKGYPIGSFFVYQAEGIFQTQAEIDAHTGTDSDGNTTLVQSGAAPGDIKFTDVNGDGVLDNDDLIYAGSGIAKVNFGLSFSASYKNFDFTLSLYGAAGNKIYNAVKQNYEAMDNYHNYLTSSLDAWTPANTDTDIPRAVLGDPNQNAKRNSTRFIENGNFLRVRNIQLGYTVPKSITERMKIQSLRVYVSGQNLLTFTGYSGIDPEVSGVLNSGTDFTSYPNIKTSLVGLQVKF